MELNYIITGIYFAGAVITLRKLARWAIDYEQPDHIFTNPVVTAAIVGTLMWPVVWIVRVGLRVDRHISLKGVVKFLFVSEKSFKHIESKQEQIDRLEVEKIKRDIYIKKLEQELFPNE